LGSTRRLAAGRGVEAAADDVAQEAFLRAYQGLARYQERGKLEAWFYRILVRQASNYRRWHALRRVWGESDEVELHGMALEPPGDPLIARRIAAALD